VEFSSLSEHLDRSTAGGSLIFNIMASLAQFERDLTVERTKAGIQAAQRRGKHCGRPRVMGQEQLDLARQMLSEGHSQRRIARVLKVSDATLSRRLRRSYGASLSGSPLGTQEWYFAITITPLSPVDRHLHGIPS